MLVCQSTDMQNVTNGNIRVCSGEQLGSGQEKVYGLKMSRLNGALQTIDT